MKKLEKAFLIFGILYMTWHLGRYFEYKQVEALKPEIVRTYYFTEPVIEDPFVNATADLFVVGNIEVGDCYKVEN